MDYDYGLYDNEATNGENYYYEGEEEEAEDEIEEFPALTLRQTYHMCLKPTVFDFSKAVSHVFLWCLVYRLSKILFKNPTPAQHIISILCGCLSLHSLFSTNIYFIIFLVLLTYFLLFTLSYLQYEKNRGFFLIIASLSYLCVCELWIVDSKQWHRIRGPQMLVVMKSVSLAFDLDIGTVKSIPNLINYSGYLLCPSSVVFGPWTSFNDYLYNYNEKWSVRAIKRILFSLVFAVVFLTISTCWAEYYIPNENWIWLLAYRDALSFRMSHYFVCFLSNVTLLLSGYSVAAFKGVARPFKVEFPRSIVDVVVYWNMPMHNWLKIYVFNTSRAFGNFVAILSTYTVSSLLHGINFQLSAVLLSLGIYSYVEVMLRKKLATAFSACILAKECKPDCSHNYKKKHPIVRVTNTFLVLLTVFHLAYLGVVFESSSQEEKDVGYTWRHSINKWASLNFLSPYVVFLTYLMYYLIK